MQSVKIAIQLVKLSGGNRILDYMRLLSLTIIVFSTLSFSNCNKPQCDLEVSIKSVIPASPKLGDEVTLVYRISNLGPDTLPRSAYQVRLEIDGNLISQNSGNASRKPGEYTDFSISKGYHHVKVNRIGSLKFAIEVVPKWMIADSIPKNNSLIKVFEVAE